MSLPRSLSTPGVLTQLSGGGKVLRRPNRPGSLKISHQASLNRLSSMSSVEMSNLEDVVVTMENICRHLVNRNYSLVVISALHGLCNSLHLHGVQLDTLYKDQLDKLMVVFRTSSRDEELDLVSRVEILHIIELRAAGWNTNDNMVAYYKQKLSHLDKMRDSPQIHTAPVSLNANAPDFTPVVGQSGSLSSLLLPGEVVGSSGKFSQPTRIPGKNYFKDEVVIRNADSGKVMGLKGRRVHMIEQLTETVVSFQRVVPGARERLVQITGPANENIVQAKLLIEETIRRNQSPIPRDDLMGSPNESLGSEGDSRRNTLIADREAVGLAEYKYTVNVADECIRITGASLDLVRTAKLVLEEYFSLGDTVNDMNKILLKDTKPPVRPTFSLGPPDTEQAPSKTLISGSSKSAFESVDSRRLQHMKMESQGREVEEEPVKQVFRPELSYSREELINLASNPSVETATKQLEAKLRNFPGIKKKEASQFDSRGHLEKGLSIFSTADYVRSYNLVEADFE